MALMLLCIISICALFSPGHSWSQDELNLFDLVEELNEDFYSLLQVPKDASASEIRKAYRKLSLQYHPDKNRDDPNAGETFRKLGAVADVLKDDYMREIYNDILENGLPDWKQPVYYYRKVKKMTFFEIMIVLFVISIIAQFLYGWAQYLEKQLVLYDLRQRKEKKDKKAKGRKNPSYHLDAEVMYHEALAKAAIPHYSRLYPCLLVRKTYHIVRWMIYKCLYVYRRWKLGSKPEETLEADTQIINPQGKKRRGRNYKKEDEIGEETVSDVENVVATNDEMKDEVIVEEVIQELTEEEKERLYEKEVEERKEFEEELKLLEENMEDDWNLITKKKTKKAHSTKIKSPQADKSLEFKSELLETFEEVTSYDDHNIPHEEAPSLPPSPPGAWSQYQQKQLEWGLTLYTKEEKNRWELIAEVVPEKSAEECKMRYKELVELVRNKKTQ